MFLFMVYIKNKYEDQNRKINVHIGPHFYVIDV